MDPDPVGSPLIWIRRYKLIGKAECNQQILGFFFVGNYIFKFKSKKAANLRFENIFFSGLIKAGFKSIFGLF